MNTTKKTNFKTKFKNFIGIYKYTLPYKSALIWSLIFLFSSTGSFMLFPILIKHLIDSTQTSQSDLNYYALWMIGILLLMSVTSYIRTIINTFLAEKATTEIKKNVYNKLITLPLHYFEKNRVGEITSKISTDIASINEMLNWGLTELLRQIIILISGVFIILFTSKELGLVMISSFPITVAVAFYFGKKIKAFSKKTLEEIGKSNVIAEETFQGILTVKSYVNEKYESIRYLRALESSMNMAIAASKFRGGLIAFIIAGIFGSIILVFWYGMTMVANHSITFGEFTSFIFVTAIIGGAVGSLGDLYAKLEKTSGASERLLEILEEESEVELNTIEIINCDGNIKFDHVEFSYPMRVDLNVLENISFEVKSGQTAAIVGQSGSGKSTIAKLILQLYDDFKGEITIDGVDIRTINKSSLRNNTALVPQDIMLFGGTIKENLSYVKQDATDKEILKALTEAHCMEFINNFPEGWHTLVGERGVQLSGGQKQRIAIARAILKNPKILILDEATSSLDSQSEQLVQMGLQYLMKGKTSIIIAHRLSTIQNADIIIVLHEGHIVETGTHQELLDANGYYTKLLKLQFNTSSSNT